MEPTVELRELRAFILVAEELHFARAAERLNLTASRVSQTIALLEARLGTRLFDRTSRRVRLTAAGEQFLAEVRPHLDGLQDALSQARQTANRTTGTLRVASYERVVAGPSFPEIVDTFRRRHPEANLDYTDTGVLINYLEHLRAGECDAVIARLPCSDRDLTVGPILTRDSRALLVPSEHPLAQRELVTLEDIADSGMPMTDVPSPGLPREMMDSFIPPLTPSGRRLRRRLTLTMSSAIVAVRNGDQVHPTVASFFDYYAHPGVTSVPLDLPPSETALVWITARSTTLLRALAQVAAEVVERVL